MHLYPSLLLPIQVLLSGATLFLVFSSYSVSKGVHCAGQLQRGDWLAVAGLLAAAVTLRLLLPPPILVHTNFHSLYFLENALGPRTTDAIELMGRAPYGMTNYSVFQLFWAYLPRTWPVYIALNVLWSAGTVPLVYLLVRLLDGTVWWALAAAALLALLPAHLKMSPTENEITLSSLFALATLVHWAAFLRTPNKTLLAGTLAALLLTVHSRVLTLAFPLALVVLYFAIPRNRRLPLPPKSVAIGGGIGAALACPQYVYIISLLVHGGAANQNARSAGKLLRLFNPESSLLFNLEVTPLIVAFAVIVGGAMLVWKRRWRGALLVVATLLLAMLYHIHSSHLLDQLRYQFFLWPFVCILAGFSIGELCTLSSSRKLRAGVLAVWCLGLSLWLVPVMPFISTVPSSSREAAFVMENVHRLPARGVLLETPPLPTTDGRIIAPLAIPAFVLDETGLGIVSRSIDEARMECGGNDNQTLVYVGLQNHSFYSGETCDNVQCLRIAPEILRLGCRLEPVVTTTINTTGPTPGPDLEFRTERAEIGFYRLVQ